IALGKEHDQADRFVQRMQNRECRRRERIEVRRREIPALVPARDQNIGVHGQEHGAQHAERSERLERAPERRAVFGRAHPHLQESTPRTVKNKLTTTIDPSNTSLRRSTMPLANSSIWLITETCAHTSRNIPASKMYSPIPSTNSP